MIKVPEKVRIIIPPDANLQDVIFILNRLGISMTIGKFEDVDDFILTHPEFVHLEDRARVFPVTPHPAASLA